MGTSLVLQTFCQALSKVNCWPDDAFMLEARSPKVILFIPREAWMRVPNLIVIHPIDVHSKPQMSPSQWHLTKCQGITKVSRIHPLGIMNVCTKCHSSLLSLWDISVWGEKVDRQTNPYCHFTSMAIKILSYPHWGYHLWRGVAATMWPLL